MNNLQEIEINFELLDATNAVHVIKSLEEGGFLVEVNGQEVEMNEETLKCAVESDEVKVTCEFEAKLDLINATKELKKVSVEVNTDGSEEVDVYVHEVKEVQDEFVVSVEGTFVKTYKSEKAAVKFAYKEATNVEVIYN